MARSRRDDDDDFEDEEERPRPRKKKRRNVDEPAPVRGETVGTSKMKLFGLIVLGLVLFPVCLWLLMDSAVFHKFVELTWWGYCLAGFGTLAGGFMAFAGVAGMLLPTQLVFGKSMFQEQRKNGGRWTVILQIPYDCIRKVKFEKYDDDSHIGFQFEDPDDPDIYCKDDSAFEVAKGKGWDYILNGLYTMSLKEIANKLKDRMDDVDD
jgi:hypothetical protein